MHACVSGDVGSGFASARHISNNKKGPQEAAPFCVTLLPEMTRTRMNRALFN
jgi:hypothetical protein